jgi:hypothetical protein
MGGYRRHLEQQLFRNYAVYNTPLKSKPGRPMTPPLTRQRLIMKPPDKPKSRRTGYCHDIFPFLISLQNILRDRCNLLVYPAVFFDAPHTILWLYHI